MRLEIVFLFSPITAATCLSSSDEFQNLVRDFRKLADVVHHSTALLVQAEQVCDMKRFNVRGAVGDPVTNWMSLVLLECFTRTKKTTLRSLLYHLEAKAPFRMRSRPRSSSTPQQASESGSDRHHVCMCVRSVHVFVNGAWERRVWEGKECEG